MLLSLSSYRFIQLSVLPLLSGVERPIRTPSCLNSILQTLDSSDGAHVDTTIALVLVSMLYQALI